LLERASQLGGKIASWNVEALGRTFTVEHGFHGFFPQYYNLKRVMAEVGATENFLSLDSYALVYKGKYKPEVFRPSNAAFPWNIVNLALSSSNRLKWGINLTHVKHLQVFREITSFSSPQSYERLDNISVSDWVGDDYPMGLYDLYFRPFAKSSLNSPDRLSAGELMQFFHFYFFGNPEGLAFNGTCQDMGRSLVDPMVEAIRANGGQVLTEVTVSQIDWQDGQVAGVTYQNGSLATSPVPFWVERNPLLSSETLEYFGSEDQLYSVAPGAAEALSLTCTHQGCVVNWKADKKAFVCPCHDAEFGADGKVLESPATRSLKTFTAKVEGDSVLVKA